MLAAVLLEVMVAVVAMRAEELKIIQEQKIQVVVLVVLE
jgi:hypothetical protein